MGKTSASNPYFNAKGDHRIGVQLDYSIALRIATGDLEALDEVAKALRVKVEAFEKKNAQESDGA